jgi:GntR family transcriptional regulator
VTLLVVAYMTLDPTDPRPPYLQLASRLRDAIDAGQVAPGELLTSVRGLAEEYGVSKVTANRAIDTLKAEGLVDTLAGRGTVVRASRPLIRVDAFLTTNALGERATWQSEGQQQGFRATQDITEVVTAPGPPEVTQRLELATDALTVIRRRVLKADDVPVQVSDSYYPADLASGTELALPQKLRGYTYGALSRLGIDLDHFRDELQVRMPSPREAQVLRLGQGTPVLRLLRTSYATDGRAVEVADQILAGDRYVLSYELEARPEAGK